MQAYSKTWLFIALLSLLAACGQKPVEAPEMASIQAEIKQRFNAAYSGLAEVSELTLTPAESELNTADHQVYDVVLTAVVTEDLQARLNSLPDTLENKLLRGRIQGMISLGAVQRGHKLTTHLRALVERHPETGQWQVVGLIKRSTPSKEKEKENKDATVG